MEYKGKLYGKIGKSYFPLESTADDFDSLEKQVAKLELERKDFKKRIIEEPARRRHLYRNAVTRVLKNKKATVIKTEHGYCLEVTLFSNEGKFLGFKQKGRGVGVGFLHLKEDTLIALIKNYTDLKQIEESSL